MMSTKKAETHLQVDLNENVNVENVRDILIELKLKPIREHVDPGHSMHLVFPSKCACEKAQEALKRGKIKWVQVHALVEPSLYSVFQLNPASHGSLLRGCDIIFPVIVDGARSRSYHKRRTQPLSTAFEDSRAVWIASPYLNAFAFDFLRTILPKNRSNSLYVITSEDNNPMNLTKPPPSTAHSSLRDAFSKLSSVQIAVSKVANRTGGEIFLKVYPPHRKEGAGAGDRPMGRKLYLGVGDRLMHRKLYLGVAFSPSQDPQDLLPLHGEYTVHDAYFGSCNFTGPGLGYKLASHQGYELVAEAKEDVSRERLKRAFLFTWNLGNTDTRPPWPGTLWKWVYKPRTLPLSSAWPCKWNAPCVETATGNAIWEKL